MNQEDLEALGLPSLKDPHIRHMRQLFLTVVTGGCVVMVPWIVYLARALPENHTAAAWKAAWVGFDVLLVGGLIGTAYGAWRRRQFVVIGAVFTATLLLCDAWFDISLDWSTKDETASMLSAVLVEIPLACYLVYTVLRILRMTIRSALMLSGYTGPIPPFYRLSIGALQELIDINNQTGAVPAVAAGEPRTDHVQ